MKALIAELHMHPKIVSATGSLFGWVGVANLAEAKDVAQLTASFIAALVSLCALILVAPRAIAQVKSWFRRRSKR